MGTSIESKLRRMTMLGQAVEVKMQDSHRRRWKWEIQQLITVVEFKNLVVSKKVEKLVTGVPEVMMGGRIVRRLVLCRVGMGLRSLYPTWGREMAHVTEGWRRTQLKQKGRK
nr:hypothetical protein CFP56_40881 [Quercus suber]